MKDIRWVIQKNLIAENDLNEIERACMHLGVAYEHVEVIPFSDRLPSFTLDGLTNVYFGSTTFMNNVYRSLNSPAGLFYNHKAFTMENYLREYGTYMLSSNGYITNFGEFLKKDLMPESLWFIRPNADDKSFNGQVISFQETQDWFDRIRKQFDNVEINEETSILVCEPYNIRREWRCYIVGGKIVTASLYRKNGKLNKSRIEVPTEMLAFAQARADEYLPHQNVAMDIGECGDEFYIIELGCLNSVGFYDADIKTLIEAVSNNMTQEQKVIQ